MNKRKQLIAKAGLAFLYCISCCAFANYVTYMVIKSYTDGGMFADLWFFLVYVIQVAAAVMAAVYGDILLKRGKTGTVRRNCRTNFAELRSRRSSS